MNTRPPACFSGRKGFTLVEMLTVLAIIALLSGTVTVLFRDGRSLGIKTSAAEVSGELSLARDLAVTSNRRTRFIIVSNADGNDPKMKLRGYTILQCVPGGAAFKVTGPLQYLPQGVYFERDQEGEATGSGIFDLQDQTSIQGKAVDYAYIEFLPTGGTSSASGANIFSLVGGSAPGQPLPQSANYARLGVSQHTGRVRIERKD